MANKNIQAQTVKVGSAGQRKAVAYAERARQQRRKNYTFIAGIVAVVTIVFVVVVVLGNQGIEITIPSNLGHYEGLLADMTEDGLPRLGNPDAPVVLEIYSSFTCGHCSHFHDTLIQLIDTYIKDGLLAVIFEPGVNDQVALTGAEAMLCAGQQDPVKAWEMHDTLFSWQGTLLFPFTQRHVTEAAKKLGLDADEFDSCMNAQATNDVLLAASLQAQERGVRGTPALFFNGERPECGGDDRCEGNLPYNIVVENIERLLVQTSNSVEAEDN